MSFPITGQVVFQPELDNLYYAVNGNGVVSGFAATQHGAGNLSVDIATGLGIINRVYKRVTAGTVTITAADATNPRIDIITCDSSGVLAVVAGTPAGSGLQAPPNLPANKILLAYVAVAAATTAILTASITDKRLIVQPNPITIIGEVKQWLKGFANIPQTLPYGWMVADGSTVSDPDSPINGQAVPNLTSTAVLVGDGIGAGTSPGNFDDAGAGYNFYTVCYIICFK